MKNFGFRIADFLGSHSSAFVVIKNSQSEIRNSFCLLVCGAARLNGSQSYLRSAIARTAGDGRILCQRI